MKDEAPRGLGLAQVSPKTKAAVLTTESGRRFKAPAEQVSSEPVPHKA